MESTQTFNIKDSLPRNSQEHIHYLQQTLNDIHVALKYAEVEDCSHLRKLAARTRSELANVALLNTDTILQV